MIGRMYIKIKKYRDALEQFFLVVNQSRRLLLDRFHGWALYYLHYSYLMLKDKEKSLTYLRLSTDILGYSKEPAIEILRKRLSNLEQGKEIKDLNDDPVVIKEQENREASRRERAIRDTQRSSSESQSPNRESDVNRQEQTGTDQRQPVINQPQRSGQNSTDTPDKK